MKMPREEKDLEAWNDKYNYDKVKKYKLRTGTMSAVFARETFTEKLEDSFHELKRLIERKTIKIGMYLQ